jgi:hypothetical protein
LSYAVDVFLISRFLCNTSGAGKTSLLLNGLNQNFGLYFTARAQPDGVGSEDMENILKKFSQEGRLMPITDQNHTTATAANRNAAERQFLLLLYGHILFLRIFLQEAFTMPDGITEDHKGCWLLIQVMPKTLLARFDDPFATFTEQLAGASAEYLRRAIKEDLAIVKGLLGSEALFCVLDEAQIPTEGFMYCFLSDSTPAEPRPILREIIRTWSDYFPNLIVSGTGVSMQTMQAVLGSSVAKEGQEAIMITNLGAFDNEQAQKAYLEYYLPPKFLETDSGKVLATRVAYWLHGRCVCNACIIVEC